MYFINKKGKAGSDLTSIYLESALFWLANPKTRTKAKYQTWLSRAKLALVFVLVLRSKALYYRRGRKQSPWTLQPSSQNKCKKKKTYRVIVLCQIDNIHDKHSHFVDKIAFKIGLNLDKLILWFRLKIKIILKNDKGVLPKKHPCTSLSLLTCTRNGGREGCWILTALSFLS